MPKNKNGNTLPNKKPKVNLFELVLPYKGITFLLLLFALLGNVVNLIIPKLISHSIDSFQKGHFDYIKLIAEFSGIAIVMFVFAYLQGITQIYVSERVGRDIRKRLSDKISQQSYAYIQRTNPSKLLSNLTSDVDGVKSFVSQGIVSIASSVFILIGTSFMLLSINWKLGLMVLGFVPVIVVVFYFIFSKVNAMFKETREVVDWLNRVIIESVMGAAIIRVLNSQQIEYMKFYNANSKAKDLGLSIRTLSALLMPTIFFVMNLASVLVLIVGGHSIIAGTMTLGEFSAFNQYILMLIFPIMALGNMSNMIAQAGASYSRVKDVLLAQDTEVDGTAVTELGGSLELKSVSVQYGEKSILKDISFSVVKGKKTAVIGPTAAGKSQLLYLLTGLNKPSNGSILYDGISIGDYKKESLSRQIGFVFQDSILFNLSLRVNIAFSDSVTDESLAKAIETAELKNFIDSLPEGLNTIISERGNSLSGGQKQRIMLARALALNPKILLLDDFTARVDAKTEEKILHNVEKNYPHLTLISVTQKIASVSHFEQIVLLMEGDLIAKGTHTELMNNCTEYVQIFDSQRSTSHYEK